MTPEERLNEVRDWARSAIEAGADGLLKEDLLHLFPELAESEDERIRKELVSMVNLALQDGSALCPGSSITKEDAIAWLEKQKEQKHAIIKPHKGDDDNPYDMGVSEAQEYAIKRGFDIPFNDGEVFVDERYITQTIGNILRWADEHPKEQKPAEKQDYSGLTDLERAIHRGFLCAGVENIPVSIIKETAQDCLAQIKPAEWSEEDDLFLQICKNALSKYQISDKWDAQIISKWLEEKLKYAHWKPSEEQMKELLSVLPVIKHTGSYSQEVLETLYGDLKKL